MKLLAALISSATLLGAALHHQDGAQTFPEPLAGDFTKLSAAKALSVHLKVRVVGESATAKEYTLEMAKDKKFKLTYDDGFILSDGNNLYTYKKASNTYSQAPLDDKSLAKFRHRVELLGWASFLEAQPGRDFTKAIVGANRTIQGVEYQTVDIALKPDNHEATLFFLPKVGVVSGFTDKVGDKQYLVIADKLNFADDAAPDADFAFVAPAGATLMKANDGNFASIQDLMNGNCMPCHSADHHSARIDLSNYAGISAIVTPSNSAGSLLIKALKGDGVDQMPKNAKPLTDDQIAGVAKWIDAGAKNE